MDTFYLGTHRPHWLADPRFTDTPLFPSRRSFYDTRTCEYRKTFPRAVGRYAIDSGRFTELRLYGRWTITADEYVAFLRRAWQEIGPFDFAAPMDWMCEPEIIYGGVYGRIEYAGTRQFLDPGERLTFDELVYEHQRLTVANGITLRALAGSLAPELPIRYTIQGYTVPQYLRCVDMYAAAGVDLGAEPGVCVGSVCRRQNTDDATEIIDALRDAGIPNIHGFGFKIEGLRRCWSQVHTADSLSWSLDGRYAGPCQHPPYATARQPKSEANCASYALDWRRRHIRAPRRQYGRQMNLFNFPAVA